MAAASYPSEGSSRYVQADPPGLECAVCMSTMVAPVVLTACGHSGCKECISSWAQQARSDGVTCPECRTTSPNWVRNIALERVLSFRPMRCIHAFVTYRNSTGKDELMYDPSLCQFVGTEREVAEHEASCRFAPGVCEYCGDAVASTLLSDHKVQCRSAATICDLADELGNVCGIQLSRADLRRHQLRECPYRVVACEEVNCTWRGPSLHSSEHADVCAYATVTCEKCGEQLRRGAMANHFTTPSMCPYRLEDGRCTFSGVCADLVAHMLCCEGRRVACTTSKKCKWKGAAYALVDHIEQDCGYVVVECPNGGCDASGKRKELSKHMEICPNTVLTCPRPGCNVVLLRSELDDHIKNAWTEHVQLQAAAMRASNSLH